MSEKILPKRKPAYHGTGGHYFFVFSSATLSLLAVSFISILAAFYHVYLKMKYGSAVKPDPSNNSDTYPDLKNLKVTTDLRYYALQIGLDLEEYIITTKDGYILKLHRLIDPNETEIDRQKKKPVLLQHGLLQCSGTYLSPGKSSLPYHIQQSGYDVWLGNNRSGFEAKHALLKGNLLHSEEYWDWDVRNLAYYDLPTIIDNILAHKPNHDKLAIVGHSQGSTQTYLMLRNEEFSDYHKKIEVFFQLAPGVFPGDLFHLAFFKFIFNMGKFGYHLLFGCNSFVRGLTRTHELLHKSRLYSAVSYYTFGFLFGWNGLRWSKDKKVWQIHFTFNLSFVATKSMAYWLNGSDDYSFNNEKKYKKKNDSPITYPANPDSLFVYDKQWFGLSEKSTIVPMVILPGTHDSMTNGKRLISHFLEYETASYKEGHNLDIHELDGYDHMDHMWADKTIETVGVKITDKLKSLNIEAAQAEIS